MMHVYLKYQCLSVFDICDETKTVSEIFAIETETQLMKPKRIRKNIATKTDSYK